MSRHGQRCTRSLRERGRQAGEAVTKVEAGRGGGYSLTMIYVHDDDVVVVRG